MHNIKFNQKTKDPDILAQIFETRSKIKDAEYSFSQATNPFLINSYIYEIKSLKERHSYLLAQVRENYIES